MNKILVMLDEVRGQVVAAQNAGKTHELTELANTIKDLQARCVDLLKLAAPAKKKPVKKRK